MSLLRTLAAAPLVLWLGGSLLACTADEPLGEWAHVNTVPGAIMEPRTTDAIGADPQLVFAVDGIDGPGVASFDVTTGALRRDPFVATWIEEHRTTATIVEYFSDELPEYRSVLVDVGARRFVFGAHQGLDGRGAAVLTTDIGPLPDVPEPMPRPSGAGAIGERPFASGAAGLHAYDPRDNAWSSVDLPEGGPWSTASVGGVAYAVGNSGAGVAIYRLDVE